MSGLFLHLFARAGAALAAEMIRFARDRFVNWRLGVVRDAETALDAMADRYTLTQFRFFHC